MGVDHGPQASAGEPPIRRRPRLLLLTAATLGFVAYLPQLTYPFVYDDVAIIVDNPVVSGGPWSDCLTQPYWPPEASLDPLYRPVTTLSLRLNHALFGQRGLGFRATNALLHGLCSALVALLAVRLIRGAPSFAQQRVGDGRSHEAAGTSVESTGPAHWVGWFAGLVFAVHPLHAEAVGLVVGRAELLAALFVLWLLARHVDEVTRRAGPSRRYHVSAAVLLLLAIGSKEHAVFALPAVMLIDIWAQRALPNETPLREHLNGLARSHYLGLLLAAAVMLVGRWLLFGGRATSPAELFSPLANPFIGQPATTVVWTAPALLLLSVRLFLAPIGLCPIWGVGGFELADTPARFDVAVGALLAMAMLLVTIRSLRRGRVAGLLIGITLLFLLLPCHFVPAANWLFAERWLYLPSAFGCVLVGMAATRFARPRLVWPIVLVVVIALFGWNWRYQQSWRSNRALGEAVVTRRPDSYQGLVTFALACQGEGQIVEARDEVERLVSLYPESARSWYCQALLMDALDEPAEALKAISRYVITDGPNLLTAELMGVRDRAEARLAESVSTPGE